MTIDIHAQVTVDPAAHLQRAALADVGLTVLLSTRVHPETAKSPAEVRAEFARLSAESTVGFVNAPLGQDAEDTRQWIARHLLEPSLVGIGELTPSPGGARLIEPVLQVSADHGGSSVHEPGR